MLVNLVPSPTTAHVQSGTENRHTWVTKLCTYIPIYQLHWCSAVFCGMACCVLRVLHASSCQLCERSSGGWRKGGDKRAPLLRKACIAILHNTLASLPIPTQIGRTVRRYTVSSLLAALRAKNTDLCNLLLIHSFSSAMCT